MKSFPTQLEFAQLVDLTMEIRESSFKESSLEGGIHGYYTYAISDSARAACLLMGFTEDFAHAILFPYCFGCWNEAYEYASKVLKEHNG